MLKVEYRLYVCSCCGAKKSISTNHRMACRDYCHGCSWKAFWKGEDESFCIPGVHRHCRIFQFVRDNTLAENEIERIIDEVLAEHPNP